VARISDKKPKTSPEAPKNPLRKQSGCQTFSHPSLNGFCVRHAPAPIKAKSSLSSPPLSPVGKGLPGCKVKGCTMSAHPRLEGLCIVHGNVDGTSVNASTRAPSPSALVTPGWMLSLEYQRIADLIVDSTKFNLTPSNKLRTIPPNVRCFEQTPFFLYSTSRLMGPS